MDCKVGPKKYDKSLTANCQLRASLHAIMQVCLSLSTPLSMKLSSANLLAHIVSYYIICLLRHVGQCRTVSNEKTFTLESGSWDELGANSFFMQSKEWVRSDLRRLKNRIQRIAFVYFGIIFVIHAYQDVDPDTIMFKIASYIFCIMWYIAWRTFKTLLLTGPELLGRFRWHLARFLPNT